jgi:hypothetical protein
MRWLVYFLLGLTCLARLAHGGLISLQSPLDLEQKADLIVVGSASSDIKVGSKVVNFDLRVNRVIAGDPEIAGKVIPVTWTTPGGFFRGIIAPVGQHIVEKGTGLWFLERSPTGWALLPAITGNSVSLKDAFFPTPDGPIASAFAYGATASLSDKVASELAAAIEATNTFSVQMASSSDSLDGLKSPVLQVLYQRMSTSASARQRILGLSGLIRGGNAVALSTAAASAPESKGTVEYGTLLSSVRDEFRATDASSITVLGRIALDSAIPDREFREAAAHALASMHTLETLPYLARLLDDPDAQLRVEGVGGLGCFANGTSVQTTANTPSLASLQLSGDGTYSTAETIANFAQGAQAIERDEGRYLAFWKAWWGTNRASLGF